jgi:hypothetical protein
MARPHSASSRGARPFEVRVRMYQVGFGDCFLLSLYYRRTLGDGRKERHVLIDFGSTHAPARAAALLPQAAQLIEQHCNGRLDVIVATHRHKDHIDGFGDADTAAIIDRLQPALVVRPWTDDPKLPADSTEPALTPTARFATGLVAAQDFSATVAAMVGTARSGSLRGELASMALDQVPNQAALDRLVSWADATSGVYVKAGSKSRIEEFVPGITVRVLGPPTARDAPEMTSQRASDPEYWMAQLQGLGGDAPLPKAVDDPGLAVTAARVKPGPVAWLVDRLERQQAESLLRLVRTVDDALNNTSVILLIDVGDKRLLFPGDAQIENWTWALKNAPDSGRIRKLLEQVDLYKVGHHGSRNATPRSLFRLWGEDPDPARPMTALMSTLSGVHGRSEATRVPRATLVAALQRRTNLITTDRLPRDTPFREIAAPTSGNKAFAVVEQ